MRAHYVRDIRHFLQYMTGRHSWHIALLLFISVTFTRPLLARFSADFVIITTHHSENNNMNEYQLLVLIEKLLSLYNDKEIALNKQARFTQEFKSLIGEVQDAVSHIE